MKAHSKVLSMRTVETIAARYLVIRAQLDALEEEKESIKEKIKDYLIEATPTQAAVFNDRKFFLCEQERELFNLTEARKVFSKSQLKPFIKVVKSVQLRVK